MYIYILVSIKLVVLHLVSSRFHNVTYSIVVYDDTTGMTSDLFVLADPLLYSSEPREIKPIRRYYPLASTLYNLDHE